MSIDLAKNDLSKIQDFIERYTADRTFDTANRALRDLNMFMLEMQTAVSYMRAAAIDGDPHSSSHRYVIKAMRIFEGEWP